MKRRRVDICTETKERNSAKVRYRNSPPHIIGTITTFITKDILIAEIYEERGDL